MGAASTRHSLRPRCFRGQDQSRPRVRSAPRDHGYVSSCGSLTI